MKATKEEISSWSLANCVDFLREKDCNNYLYLLHHKTPLIACRKAVLAVLEKARE